MLKIIDNFYQNTDLLDDLYRFFYYAGTWQFDYFSHKYVWKEKQSTKTEEQVCTLIRRICVTNPKFSARGYESWINVAFNNMIVALQVYNKIWIFDDALST